MTSRPAFPSATFVGRSAELLRLEEGLSRVPVAGICGAAGLGKSALAAAFAARWKGPSILVRASREAAAAALIDDARRQLAQGAIAQATDDDERLADLAERMEREGALFILDDADRLEASTRDALLTGLSVRLQHGRVLLTSRELLAGQHASLDMLEVRLPGLDDQNARVLWAALDELYGPADGMDQAIAKARGSPLLLRQAHVGELADEAPWADVFRALEPAQRRVAAALALSEIRLPAAVLRSLGDEQKSAQNLRALVTRMVAEVDGAGRCAVHDLFRDSILRELSPEEASGLRRDLARGLAAADLDPVVRVREVGRHLVALGELDALGEYVLGQATELIRLGAAGEILRALDPIPPERRTLPVQISRCRAMVRMLSLGQAFEELGRMLESGLQPRCEILAVHGQVATMIGRVKEAEESLQAALADPALSPRTQLRAATALALLRGQERRGDEARAILDAEEKKAKDPAIQGILTGFRALTFILDGRHADAEALIPRMEGLLPNQPSYIKRTIAPLLFAAIRARQGRLDEAEELCATVERALSQGEDLLARVYMRFIRALCLHERGSRVEALAEFRELVAILDRCQFQVLEGPCHLFTARTLIQLGRRDQANAILDGLTRRAHATKLASALGMIERTQRHDILAQLEEPYQPKRDQRGERARAAALNALRAAAQGDPARVEALIGAGAKDFSGPGYGLERACAELARSIVARLEGDTARAQEAWARAQREAAEDGVDPGLLPQIAERVGSSRTVDAGRQARMVFDVSAAVQGHEVVIDARVHELRLPTSIVALEKRPVLRKLLYALAQRPNARVMNEELARAIWDRPYNRRSDENALRVNIKNLRSLLSPTPLQVKLEDDGYSLAAPATFLFVEPMR